MSECMPECVVWVRLCNLLQVMTEPDTKTAAEHSVLQQLQSSGLAQDTAVKLLSDALHAMREAGADGVPFDEIPAMVQRIVGGLDAEVRWLVMTRWLCVCNMHVMPVLCQASSCQSILQAL